VCLSLNENINFVVVGSQYFRLRISLNHNRSFHIMSLMVALINVMYGQIHCLASLVLSPDVQNEHRCDEDETHDKDGHWADFDSWGVLSVEPPHASTAAGSFTSST